MKADIEQNNNYLPLIVEEAKEAEKPLLLSEDAYKGRILFTTNKKDPKEMHIMKDSIVYVGTNIPSYMGGRAEPWQ